jgi:hypothetical protein
LKSPDIKKCKKKYQKKKKEKIDNLQSSLGGQRPPALRRS